MIDDFNISCIHSYHDDCEGQKRGENRIYKIMVDGISILHLGDLGHMISKESAGDVDVLLLPVGGFFTIDAETAISLIEVLKPKVVIPMHYKTKSGTLNQISDLDTFLDLWPGKLIRTNENNSVFEIDALNAITSTEVVTLNIG